MNIINISLSGPFRFIKDKTGHVWKFEDNPNIGPIVVDNEGEPEQKQPLENIPFWNEVNKWYEQGKKTAKRYDCIWCVVT